MSPIWSDGFDWFQWAYVLASFDFDLFTRLTGLTGGQICFWLAFYSSFPLLLPLQLSRKRCKVRVTCSLTVTEQLLSCCDDWLDVCFDLLTVDCKQRSSTSATCGLTCWQQCSPWTKCWRTCWGRMQRHRQSSTTDGNGWSYWHSERCEQGDTSRWRNRRPPSSLGREWHSWMEADLYRSIASV